MKRTKELTRTLMMFILIFGLGTSVSAQKGKGQAKKDEKMAMKEERKLASEERKEARILLKEEIEYIGADVTLGEEEKEVLIKEKKEAFREAYLAPGRMKGKALKDKGGKGNAKNAERKNHMKGVEMSKNKRKRALDNLDRAESRLLDQLEDGKITEEHFDKRKDRINALRERLGR